MVYSVNQVRQFYVADNTTTCKQGADGSFYVEVKDAKGNTKATQSINPEDVDWISLTAAEAQAIKMKKVVIKLNSEAFPNNKVISGQDYLLRVQFRQLYGMSDEDIYQKYAVVHGISGMTVKDFLEKLQNSFEKNMSRDLLNVLKFEHNSATTASNATITITEKPQTDEWALGTKKLERVYFDVIPTTVVTKEKDEISWVSELPLKVEDSDTTISNYYQIADMEYFYHGYRGDQYRNVGWPNVITYDYMIKGTEDNIKKGFDVLDIQYHYAGDNEDSLKSAKTITIVAPAGSTALKNLASSVAGCAGKKYKNVDKDGTTYVAGSTGSLSGAPAREFGTL